MDGPPALKMGGEGLERTSKPTGKLGVNVPCSAPCDARGPRLVAAAWSRMADATKVAVLQAVAAGLGSASSTRAESRAPARA